MALGLAWLKEVAPEELAQRPAGPPAPERPRTPEEVQQWLEARHVSHLRKRPLSVLEPLVPRGSMAALVLVRIGHEPLTALLEGTLKPRLSPLQGTPAQASLLDAAWAYAEAEAGLVRQGLEWERLHPEPPPPTDARLEPLFQALRRLRARVREHTFPRVLPAQDVHLGLVDEPPVLHVHEAWYHYGARQPPQTGDHHQCVRVEPLRVLTGEDAVSCSTCSPREPAGCLHALAALDVLLGALGDSRRAEANARLAENLLVKPGRKLLEALERASVLARSPHESSGPGLQVSFRLEGLEAGAPRLRPYLHKPLKRGGVSKGTPLSSRDASEARALLSAPEELEALEVCLLAEQQYGSVERHRLMVQALKLLAHSPRLVLDSRLDAPLRVRSLPLGFAVEETEEAGGALWVHPVVGEARLRVRGLNARAPQPWLFAEPREARLTLVSASPAALAVLEAVAASGGRLPAAWKTELVERLGGVEAAFPLALPPSLEGREVPPVPGLLLRLRPTGAESLEGELLVRPLPEAPALVPGEGGEVVRGLREGARVRARRNLEAERVEAAALLERLGLPVEEHGRFTLEGPEAALGFLERLEPLTGPSLRVEWEERPWRMVHSPDARGLKVAVRQERDWFGVAGGVQLEGERVELAVLLDAMRRGHRYVPLAPGRWMKLTETLREQLTPLADLAHPSRGKWEVSAAAASALDGLAEAGAEVVAPLDWRRLAGRIREAQKMEVPVPAGLKAGLRDYQREGFVWMARLAAWGGGGCLADDMGLGKTLQALALLLHRAEAGPALVVAPTSVCFNWVREAARFAPSLKVHAYREAEREELLSGLGAGDVVVVSYRLLMREAGRFSEVSFATLVLDEAQAVKNPDTARARAVRALKAEARMALSGTPVENRLSELWSLYRLVFPGLLGSRESFRERFAAPIERSKDPAGARGAGAGGAALPAAAHQGGGGARAAAPRGDGGARHPLRGRAPAVRGHAAGGAGAAGGRRGPEEALRGAGGAHPAAAGGLPPEAGGRGLAAAVLEAGAPPGGGGGRARRGRPGARLQPVRQAPGAGARGAGGAGRAAAVPGRADARGRARDAGGGLPAGRGGRLPHLAQGGGHGPQPHRGGPRAAPGPVVEPGGGGSGHGPGAPHRPDEARHGDAPHLRGHHRGGHPRAARGEARPGQQPAVRGGRGGGALHRAAPRAAALRARGGWLRRATAPRASGPGVTGRGGARRVTGVRPGRHQGPGRVA